MHFSSGRTEYFLILFLILCCTGSCLSLSKFTNIQCLNMDASLSEFTLCRMRAVKRDVNELTIKANIFGNLSSDIVMRLQLLKKASGYKPFLYDVHVDLCEYLDKRNHPFVNIIFSSLGNYSHGYHRCPIGNAISLEDFPFPHTALKAMPLPFGEYAIFGTFGVNEIEQATVKIYFQLSEF